MSLTNPLQSDRVELLKSFPQSTKKTAVVHVDEPAVVLVDELGAEENPEQP